MAESLDSRIVRIQVELLRLEAGTRRKVRDVLRRMEAELVAALQNADPTGIGRTTLQNQRAEALLSDVQGILAARYGELQALLTNEAAGIAAHEATAAARAVNLAVGLEIVNPTVMPATIRKLASDPVVDGLRIGEWLAQQKVRTANRFMRAVRMGILASETLPQIARRIRGTATTPGVMPVSRREAEVLSRTAVISISNKARIDQYLASPGSRGIRWVSTLDNRTTPICRALDGKAWDKDLKPIGHKFDFPGPTAHWGCRSTQVPLLEKYADLLTNQKAAAILERWREGGTRSAEFGPVPSRMTYEQWFRTQTAAYQRDVLGPGRYRLWSDGKLSFEDMVDMSGRPLTLNELRAI